jgi:dTDP-4-dehydrorhamnose 3,5-epimerase
VTRSAPDGVTILAGGEIAAGVLVTPLRRIPDERGTIYHMLRHTDRHFVQFGEIYFTTLYRGVVKAWHKHREMTLNYACIFGAVKLVVFDDRVDSPTLGSLTEVFLGSDNYSLVTIPEGVWSGLKGMTDPYAIVANCATHPHDPQRTTRMDPFDTQIPYSWNVKHR